MNDLTHFDKDGRAAMVDVGGKAVTARRAVAIGKVMMHPQTLEIVTSGGAKKGDVISGYDMLKAVDREMVIGEIKLVEKSGGKSGDWRAER